METLSLTNRIGGASPVCAEIDLKREDVSLIRSYKWRGAFNKIYHCVSQGIEGPFVATSAGNHAQGVAISAAALDVKATIFMPQTTPRLKQRAVVQHGGKNVDVVLCGDTFDEAQAAASLYAKEHNATVIPPFDDFHVIAGQSTVGSEILVDSPAVEHLFVPIGGGGLASGVAFAFRELHQHPCRVIGVEVVGQDSMTQSLLHQEQVTLGAVDRFCDGTAVGKAGNLTWEICRDYLADTMTVTNEEVCAAIQTLWEEKRVITEPSGAIGLAGLRKAWSQSLIDPARSRCGTILTGGNTDFLTLPLIVKRSQLAQSTRRYFRFEISERNGSLIDLLDQFMDGINIIDFQYGKQNPGEATPVLGLSGSAEQLTEFVRRIGNSTIGVTEVTDHQATLFRAIPFRPDLVQHPIFLHVDFPDRPGALREMMREISQLTNICYFNFNDSGQSEGHALIGFEFDAVAGQKQLFNAIDRMDFRYQLVNMGGFIEE